MKTFVTLFCTAMLSMPFVAHAECGGGSCDKDKCTCESDCKACDGGSECTCKECTCEDCKDKK